jgi:hypothetical protein
MIMIHNFSVTLDPKNSQRYLKKSLNSYFNNGAELVDDVIAPKDKNYVIYFNNHSIDVSVLEDECFEDTIASFKGYLGNYFKEQTIGIYFTNPRLKSILREINNVRTVILS